LVYIMVMVSCFTRILVAMKVNLTMVNEMVLVIISLLMVIIIEDNGLIINVMVKDLNISPRIRSVHCYTKENGETMREKD